METRAETQTQAVAVLPTGPRIDPFPMYARMRDEAVVHVVQEATGLRRWMVVRYAEGREVLADDRFSKDPKQAWEQLRDAGYVTGERDEQADYLYHIANSDPPDHTRLRKLISKAFGTRRIEQWRPRCEQLAEELLSKLDGEVDLIDAYAHPFATTIMCEILGVPALDRHLFRTWATALLTAPDIAKAQGLMTKQEGYAAMRAFFTDLVARKRAEGITDPEADVLSGLITARDGADRLSETELISTTMLLMSAGQEPTVNLINNGVFALLRHPDQLARLVNEPELIGTAIEEFLRFDPPVELSTTRVAKEDVEIAGVVIPAGSVVTVSLASAGRDEARFGDPDRLDIAREDGSAHVAFGYGMHLCIGAPLARMQGQVAIAALLRRFPGIRLACEESDLRWRPTRIMRGLVELPVNLSASA